MDSPSSRGSVYCTSTKKKNRHHEEFVARVISPAILGHSCPICLNTLSDRRAAVLTVCSHAYCLDCIRKWSNLKRNCPLCNATFDSWFYKINLSARNFLREHLPPFSKGKAVTPQSHFSSGGPPQRIMQRSSSRDEGGRQLPWRRSFGRPGSVPDDIIADRKLQWRASVYNRRLQAVPLSTRNCRDLNVLGNNFVKERILQRIEPWIRRELQAILGDPDPAVVVHVASSLFIAGLEGNFNASRQLRVEDDFLAPLRPFLHDQTAMFWHELRDMKMVCGQHNLSDHSQLVAYGRKAVYFFLALWRASEMRGLSRYFSQLGQLRMSHVLVEQKSRLRSELRIATGAKCLESWLSQGGAKAYRTIEYKG